jgi:hypothetical protein
MEYHDRLVGMAGVSLVCYKSNCGDYFLQLRNYVRLEKRRIFPETRGRMVNTCLNILFCLEEF